MVQPLRRSTSRWARPAHSQLPIAFGRPATPNSPAPTSKRAKEWRWVERAIAWDKAGREEKAALRGSPRSRSPRTQPAPQYQNLRSRLLRLRRSRPVRICPKRKARALPPVNCAALLRIASELQRRERQSHRASDHFSANDGWPELDPEIEKILDMYADESQETD